MDSSGAGVEASGAVVSAGAGFTGAVSGTGAGVTLWAGAGTSVATAAEAADGE